MKHKYVTNISFSDAKQALNQKTCFPSTTAIAAPGIVTATAVRMEQLIATVPV